MESEKIKELREKFEEIQNMDNFDDLTGIIDDLNVFEVIDRRKPEVKKEYENSQEGELLQEFDETRDVTERAAIKERILELRRKRREEIQSKRKYYTYDTEEQLIQELNDTDDNERKLAIIDEIKANRTKRKEETTTELIDEVKLKIEQNKEKIEANKSKIEKLKEKNEKLHEEEKAYLAEILENEGIMELKLKRGKTDSKVYISAKEENEELLKAKRKKVSAIKGNETKIKKLEAENESLEDEIVNFDDILCEIQGIKKEEIEEIKEDKEQENQEQSDENQEQHEDGKNVIIATSERTPETQEKSDSKVTADSSDKQAPIIIPIVKSNTTENHPPVSQVASKTPKTTNKSSHVIATSAVPTASTVMNASKQAKSSTPKDIIAPSSAAAGLLHKALVTEFEKEENDSSKGTTKPITLAKTEEKIAEQLYKLRTMGFYIKETGTPIYYITYSHGDKIKIEEFDAFKYTEKMNSEKAKALSKQKIKSPKVYYDVGLENVLKEFDEKHNTQMVTKYMEFMKKDAEPEKMDFKIGYNFANSTFYTPGQRMQLNRLKRIGKADDWAGIARYQGEESFIKRISRVIKNKRNQITASSETKNKIDSKDPVIKAYEDLRDEPGFEIEEFIKAYDMSDIAASEYRELHTKKGKEFRDGLKVINDNISVREGIAKNIERSEKEQQKEM